MRTDTDVDDRDSDDEDDSDVDRCDGDSDDDGEDDEDEEDLLGTIESFTEGQLVITTVNGDQVTGTVTDDTEIEFEDHEGEGDDEGTSADFTPGVEVAEIEFEDDSSDVEEIEIYSASAGQM